MIAIAVFTIGVLAVLRMLTSNLVAVDRTETRTIATFLAKEWLELVYNIRDANIQKWLPWHCVLSEDIVVDGSMGISDDPLTLIQACSWSFASGANEERALALWFSQTGYFFIKALPLSEDFSINFSSFALWHMTSMLWSIPMSRYGHDHTPHTDTPQIFARYIVFTGVSADHDQILPLHDVLKVESHVLFSKWGSTGEVVLESFVGKQ